MWFRKKVPTPPIEERLSGIDWFQFEKLVGLLFESEGHPVRRLGGAHPDGGVDLIVTAPEGHEVLIQCKHWRSYNVGVRHVREMLGSMIDFNVQAAIFITLRGYTAEAKALAEKHNVVILDQRDVLQMIAETEPNVRTQIDKLLNDTTKLCPKCESPMVLRTASKGANEGGKFWGCSTYPKCRYTLAAS